MIDMVGAIILKDDMSGRLLWLDIVELGGVEVSYNVKSAYRQVATRWFHVPLSGLFTAGCLRR